MKEHSGATRLKSNEVQNNICRSPSIKPPPAGSRTSAHEMGHLLGLGHRNHDTSNLMAQGQSYKRGNDINSRNY